VGYIWTPATWLDNAQIADPTVTGPLQTITYSLSVVDANQCSSLRAAVVTVTVTQPPRVFIGDDTSVLIGQSLPLDAVDVGNSGVVSWQWTPATGLNNPSIPDPVATITSDVTYFATATTTDGCAGTDSISVKVYLVSDIVAPNAFTPNGDGRNDRFKAVALGIRDFQYLAVYNRWGQRVFYSTDAAQGWDGILAGQVQATGVYVWMAAGVDYHGNTIQRKGTVILIR
jgi:gliding motility-associated-like protein